MFRVKFSKTAACFLLLILTLSLSAQTKRKTTKKKTVKKAAPTKTQSVAENGATTTPEIKKNARPETESEQTAPEQASKTNSRPVTVKKNAPVYFYEFSQPSFAISQVYIEHDENGTGKITFQKKDLPDMISDPLQLSPATLEKLKTAWSALNFLDSTENYQTVRDYSNLGTMKLSMRKDNRERTATFNWTENKDAKTLADEYRRIQQQFIWVFEIGVARENQPLDAPRLLESLDSMVRRSEVSDAAQMLPLLTELSNDERIPLIARNRAAKLTKEIEKKKEDKK